jgi:hypothetical protein
MSDTPRTDAAWNRAHTDDIEAGWSFAHQLERELTAANADRLRLRGLLAEIGRGSWKYIENGQAFIDISEALTTPPPAVVDKRDADALADALRKATDEGLWRSEEDSLGHYSLAVETLETYRTKYQCTH